MLGRFVHSVYVSFCFLKQNHCFYKVFHILHSKQLGRDPTPVYKAARLLMNMQLETGEFPQQVINISEHIVFQLKLMLLLR